MGRIEVVFTMQGLKLSLLLFALVAVVPESDFLELPLGGSPAEKVVKEESALVQTKAKSKFGPLFGGKGWIFGAYGEDYGYGDTTDVSGSGSAAGSSAEEAEIPVALQAETTLFQNLNVDGHVYKKH